MGCGGSKGNDMVQLNEQQLMTLKRQEQIAAQHQQQMKAQTAALEYAMQQQQISAKQFEEQRELLLQQQAHLVKQQEEALKMAMIAKEQAEVAADSSVEQALKKAEALKKRLTPPAKPGKVNMLLNTDRSIPPNAIMKRRKKYDENGNLIPPTGDHRDECGGVGTTAVEAPAIAQVPVMVAKEKEKKETDGGDDDDDDDEYEYQYEYQYQYQYDDTVAGPQAMIKTADEKSLPPPPPAIAALVQPTQALVKEEAQRGRSSSAKSAPGSVGSNNASGNDRPSIATDHSSQPANPQAQPNEEYEYEYEYE